MMLEASLVKHCAPTMAGLKPANMFFYHPEDEHCFAHQFKACRELLEQFGLCLEVLTVRRERGSYLLYLYRQKDLNSILSDPANREYLAAAGYDLQRGQGRLLPQLAGRLRTQREFPHEIGLLLGYPLEDVRGFIMNRGANSACSGCWKAYGDTTKAERCFARYRRCTETYKQRYENGAPITRLLVDAQ